MKRIWRFAAVSLGPGAVLFLALVGFAAFDVYVRGNCDPKFGCLGSVHFAAFVTGLMLACSLSGHFIACLIFRKTVSGLSGWRLLGVVLALSLGQGALFASVGRLLPGDTVTGMMLAWAAISSGIALGVLYLAGRWRSSNPLGPNPAHGSA